MQAGSPYWSNTHPDHDKYIQRVLKINEDLYPEPEG
jgi:hypothetical protein